MRFIFTSLLCVFAAFRVEAARLLIPMDAAQTNHLKAYGVIFNHLSAGQTAQWLLNYRGGSFMAEYSVELDRATRFIEGSPDQNEAWTLLCQSLLAANEFMYLR